MKPDAMLSSREREWSERFLRDGYLILDVDDMDAWEKVHDVLQDAVRGHLGEPTDLKAVHSQVPSDELNDLRLGVIRGVNEHDAFRQHYYDVARYALHALVGNELAMQNQVNLSIQTPGDDRSLLPLHADTWSGNSPYEVVVWMPMTDCSHTASMFLLPLAASRRFYSEFSSERWHEPEALMEAYEKERVWIDIRKGQFLIFSHTLVHGNVINQESYTRWSFNVRFKSLLTPYGDKGLGESFLPITLRAATRIGHAYEDPS